jgi:4-azaleucine resistance transporter AzlC
VNASPAAGGFGAGFRAMVPLWIGVLPFGAAYAVSARAAGIELVHTQLMSLLVFAGGAQFAAVGLIAAGAGPWTLVSTTFLLNLRHLLYGVVVAATTELRGARRLLAAHLLTDEAFGVHVAHGRGRPAFLFGAGLSLFVVWNASTLVGSLLARSLPEPHAIGLDIVFPLAFLALLVPLVRDRRTLAVAGIAGLGAWGLADVLEPGAALLVATALAAGIGAALPAGPRGAP